MPTLFRAQTAVKDSKSSSIFRYVSIYFEFIVYIKFFWVLIFIYLGEKKENVLTILQIYVSLYFEFVVYIKFFSFNFIYF